MTQRTRYSIILFGFIFFLIAAPAIVLYVRGITYDFKNKTFVKTGILAVRSDPSDAQVLLDGRLKRKNSGDIKFVLPGEYEVTLKKTGYSDWNKRITVMAGQAVWASPSFNSIYLFKTNPASGDLASGVLDFYTQGGNLVYLDKENLTIFSLNTPGSQKSYPLPKSVNKIVLADSAGKNFVLTNSSGTSSQPALLIFNQDSGQFSDVGGLFDDRPKIQFGDTGKIYALSDNVLYSVNPENKTKTVLFSNVQAFYPESGSLYFLQSKGQDNGLFISQSPFSGSQELLAGLQQFETADLFVTYEKEIFLLSEGRLYLMNSGSQQLADNISAFNFNPIDSFLSIIHSGELDYYDPLGDSLDFVTRSSEPLKNPLVKPSISNSFFLQGNKLEVIELDNRDSQNQYQLYSGADVKKFFVDDAGKNVLLLDGSTLKSVNIR